jgi:adenylosuccinate lyase
VERGIAPDATIHLDFRPASARPGVIEKLLIYPERMRANLDLLGGLHNSQRVLLALTQAGASREDAYRLVQRNAMAVWQMAAPRPAGALIDRLKADSEVTALLPPAAVGAAVRRRSPLCPCRHDL